MSEAEHMTEGVSKAEAEEIGRGSPFGPTLFMVKKKKVLKHFCNNNVKPLVGFQ